MYHILICDDERDIVNALKIYLHDERGIGADRKAGNAACPDGYYDAGNGWHRSDD